MNPSVPGANIFDTPGSNRVIWLSDLHYEHRKTVLGHDPRTRLDAAISFINAHYSDADLCLISGDMVETATAINYTSLRARLDQLVIPWAPMTGNHDDRTMLLSHLPLPDTAMPGFAQYVVDLPQARLICLDSLKPGVAAGSLCPARLDWLKDTIQTNTGNPVLVFLHHPPLALGLPMLDPDRLENGEALLDLLSDYPSVRHLFFGHVHRPVSGHVDALSFTGIRSVLYQAPPPYPTWDWNTFSPAHEAPELGVIEMTGTSLTVQFIPFCNAEAGIEKHLT